MRILDFPWAGIRASDFEGTVKFFAGLFGFPTFLQDDGRQIAHFRFASGHHFEIFGPKNRHYPLHACPVIAFRVEDLLDVRRELAEVGVEPATRINTAMGETWFYFRGPDGRLFELIQHVEESEPPLPAALTSPLTGFAYAGIMTADLAMAGAFFGGLLGLRQLRTKAKDDNLYRLPSGQMFELFGPENEFGFDHDCLVLGFKTGDIEAAYRRLSDLGAELPGEISRMGNGYAWFDFHGPDDIVYSVSYSPE